MTACTAPGDGTGDDYDDGVGGGVNDVDDVTADDDDVDDYDEDKAQIEMIPRWRKRMMRKEEESRHGGKMEVLVGVTMRTVG